MKVTVNKIEDNLEYPYLGVSLSTGSVYIVTGVGYKYDTLEVICVQDGGLGERIGRIYNNMMKYNIKPLKGSITLSNE